jgi:hypothetical protein
VSAKDTAHHKDFGSFDARKASHKGETGETVAKKRGLVRQIFDALMRSPQRDVDRQISRFLAQSGRAFSDDLEREITRRLLTSNWSVNAAPNDDRRFP